MRSHGDDTLSFFKLREDKQYLFSPDRRAFVGYRVENGVLLVSGDPVGPADALPALARELREFAEVRGLKLAVLGASDRSLAALERAGRALVLHRRRGRRRRRRLLARGPPDPQGAPVGVADGEGGLHGGAARARLARRRRRSASSSTCPTAGARATPERGFSMAMDSLRGDHLHDSLVLVARDEDGAAPCAASCTSCRSTAGRRCRSASCGASSTPRTGSPSSWSCAAIEALRERGIEEASLNFAAFARSCTRRAAGSSGCWAGS